MDIPIYERVTGLVVHQAQISGCAIVELPDGSVTFDRPEFADLKRDRKGLAEWALSIGPDIVVMESNSTHCKSAYATLDGVGIVALLVNARQGGYGSQDRCGQCTVAGIVGARRYLARLLHCQFGPAQPATHCAARVKTRQHAGQRQQRAELAPSLN